MAIKRYGKALSNTPVETSPTLANNAPVVVAVKSIVITKLF